MTSTKKIRTKKNEQPIGFTLIEVLGVVVILGMLSIIVIPRIISQIQNKKNDVSEVVLDLIYSATSDYVSNFENIYPKVEGNVFCVSLEELVLNGRLEEPIIDVKTGNNIPLTKMIKVYIENNEYKYAYDASECSSEVIDDGEVKGVSVRLKSKTTSSITVMGYVSQTGNEVTKYEFSINNGKWIDNGSNDAYQFKNLVTGKYSIRVRVTNATGSTVTSSSIEVELNPVLAPTISINPSGDTWEKSKTVTVNIPSDEFGTYYSIDGGSSWNLITSSNNQILFTNNGNIIAYASDGTNTSNNVSYSVVKVDSLSPVISSAGASTAWTNTDKLLTVTASDTGGSGLTGYYLGTTSTKPDVSALGWQTFDTFTKDLGTYYVFVKDLVGNVSEGTLVNVINIDKIAPSCGTITGGSTTWTNGNRTVGVACSDTESGCATGTFNTTYTVTTQTSNITISDNVGNSRSCPVNVYVDKDTPSCGTITGGSTAWTNANRTVSVACSDTGSGCTLSSYSNTYSNTTQTANITIADSAGNSRSCSVNAYVDKDIPSVPTSIVRYGSSGGTVRANNDSSWTNQALWWGSFSGTDSSSGINRYEYSTSCTGSVAGTLSSSYTYTNNNYDFCIRSVDNAGNASGWSAVTYIRADTVAPSVPTSIVRYGSSGGTVRANNDSSWTNQVLWWGSFSGTDSSSGINRYEWSTSCTGSPSGTLGTEYAYGNNNYDFCIRSVDNAGNASGWSSATYIRADTVAPTTPTIALKLDSTSGSAYTSGAWTAQNVMQQQSSSDSASGLQKYIYSTDSVNFADMPTNWLISWEGQWNFYVKAVDNAGNQSASASVYTIRIDKSAPTCSITGNPTGWVASATLTITGTDSGSGVNGILRPGDGAYTTFANLSTASTALWINNNGTYTATVRDASGRTTACSVNVTLIDKTPPTISFPTNPVYVKRNVNNALTAYSNISDSGCGVSSISIREGGTAVSSTSQLGYGGHTLTYTATDYAGNSASANLTMYIYVDPRDNGTPSPFEAGKTIFEGPNPSNYVLFNGEYWRFVSIEADGTYKIIRNDHIGSMRWDPAADGNWPGSELQVYLNGTYYNGLSANAKAQIQYRNWDIGIYAAGASTNISIYAAIFGGDKVTQWAGNVALIQPTDYMVAGIDAACENYNTTCSDPYNCRLNNWLFTGYRYHVLNSYSATRNRTINSTGSISLYLPYELYYVRPAVYLKASCSFIGTGTSADPFQIIGW